MCCAVEKKKATSEEPPPATAPDVVPVAVEAPTQTSGVVDVEKRMKAIQKKLKQIDELKAKRAAGGVLDEAQVTPNLTSPCRYR